MSNCKVPLGGFRGLYPMHNTIQLTLTPEQAADQSAILANVVSELSVSPERITLTRILKKSIDARSSQIKVNLTIEVCWDEPAPVIVPPAFNYHLVGNCPVAVIVGAGPAGLFAALKLIESGIKPILLERGKGVSERSVGALNCHRSRSGFSSSPLAGA